MSFKISRNLQLPTGAITEKLAILGSTGCGKTSAAAVLAEQLCAQGYPFVIIDPQGDHWGLRSHYPITILGGEHADAPLEPTAGQVVADFVVQERRPTLLDLFGMGEGEMVRFIGDFARQLWKANREALHVFLDEADLFAPQSSSKGQKAVSLGAMQNIVRRGRSRGLGVTMITQRSAVLNKDLLTQAQTLFVMRMTAPQDLKAVEGWINYHGNDLRAKELLATVPKLKVGDAIVYSPSFLDVLAPIHFYRRRSFDSSATPAPGEVRADPRHWKAIDLESLSVRMAATIEQAKEKDPVELKRRIASLQQKIRTLEQAKPGIDPGEYNAGIAARDAHWEGEIQQLRTRLEAEARRRQQIYELVKGSVDLAVTAAPQIRPPAAAPSPRRQHTPLAADSNGSDGLSRMERRFLVVLAQHPRGRTKSQLLILANYRSSGPVSKCFASMQRNGWTQTTGGIVTITPVGLAVLGPNWAPLPSGADLRQLRLDEAGPMERAFLKALFDVYPEDISKGELLTQTDYRSSGPVSKLFAKLVRLGWADKAGSGRLRAGAVFFE